MWEKRKIRKSYRLSHSNDVTWKDWYAWYPIKVDGHWAWFKVIQKKYEYHIRDSHWVYRRKD